MVFIDWHRRIIKLFFFFNFRIKYSLVVVEMRRWIGFLEGRSHSEMTLDFAFSGYSKTSLFGGGISCERRLNEFQVLLQVHFPSVQIWGWVIGFIGLCKHQPSTKSVCGGFLEINLLSFGVFSVRSLQRLHFCFSFLTSSGIFLMYHRSCK